MLYTYMLYIHARVYVRMLTTPLHPQELRKSSSSSPQLWLVTTCLDRASGFLLTFGPRDLEPPPPPAGAPRQRPRPEPTAAVESGAGGVGRLRGDSWTDEGLLPQPRGKVARLGKVM